MSHSQPARQQHGGSDLLVDVSMLQVGKEEDCAAEGSLCAVSMRKTLADEVIRFQCFSAEVTGDVHDSFH